MYPTPDNLAPISYVRLVTFRIPKYILLIALFALHLLVWRPCELPMTRRRQGRIEDIAADPNSWPRKGSLLFLFLLDPTVSLLMLSSYVSCLATQPDHHILAQVVQASRHMFAISAHVRMCGAQS